MIEFQWNFLGEIAFQFIEYTDSAGDFTLNKLEVCAKFTVIFKGRAAQICLQKYIV